MSSAEQQGL